MLVMRIIVARDTDTADTIPKASAAERLKAFDNVLPVIGVFMVVIVGIYGGWANPTAAPMAAASVGLAQPP